MKKFFILIAGVMLLPAAGSEISGRQISNGIIKENKLASVATRVYFSNQVPVAGIATEGTVFDIDPTLGSFLYMVVDNYPDNFSYDQIQLKVYKTVSGVNEKYDDKTYNISTTQYFTYVKYSFFTAGDYIFEVYNKYGTFIGSAKVTINYKGSSAQATPSSSSNSTSYNADDPYAKSKVYFSTEVPFYGIAKDVKSFKINRKGGFVYVIVDNYPNNFNIASLRLYVYKKKKGVYESFDDATYTISANNYFTYFKYTFDDEGDYKFIVYDGNNKYVNTGYVEIK